MPFNNIAPVYIRSNIIFNRKHLNLKPTVQQN
nr:MAG TPA: hypothetical protein [Caudoviricetes sp.]